MMDGSMNANHAGPPGGATPSPPGGNHTQPPGAAIVDHRKFDVEYQTQTLNAYIYDYLRKQNLNQTATSLLNEGSFPANPVVIENRDGGLLEWWLSLFWDAYLQRLLQKPDGSVQGGAAGAGGPGAGTGLAPGGAAVGAAAAAEPKARPAMRPVTVSEPKKASDVNAAVHGPPAASSAAPPPPYVPPPYKTVSRTGPSPQSMYIVSGWPNPFAAPSGFPPPSSPDVSSVPSPAGAGIPPRSPQTAADGVEEEAKKRGKGRRRSNIVEGPGAAPGSVPPTNGTAQSGATGAGGAGAVGGAQRGEQNAAQLPYANVPYRNPDGSPAMISTPGKPPLFYTTVGYPPPPRAPVPMAKGAPALFFPGVNYAAAPHPPRPYAPVPQPQAPPHAPPVYSGIARVPFVDTTRSHWKADESSKRKVPEEPPIPTGAPAPHRDTSGTVPAAAGQPSAAGVPAAARGSRIWPYAFVGNAAPQMPSYATAVPPAAYASPYAAPQWSAMDPSVGAAAPPDDAALVYQPPPNQALAASTSTEFYSTLGTFFEDDAPSQLGGSAAAGAGGAVAGGGEAEGGLTSSVGGNVDPDAFLASGAGDDPQNNS